MRERFAVGAVVLLAMIVLAACVPGAHDGGGMADAGGMDDAAMAPMSMADLMAQGGQVYADNCSGCHGANGEGGFGVAHAGNQNLADGGFVIDRILNGQGNMPAWADRLDDIQIASVATFIRNSFGNDFGIVQYPDVADRR